MADFTFLFNRKGAIYPLDLKSDHSPSVNVNVIGESSVTVTPSNDNEEDEENEGRESNEQKEKAEAEKLAENNNKKKKNSSHTKVRDWPFNANGLESTTLVKLCCKTIVQSMSSTQIDHITEVIPGELYLPLFNASLYPVKGHAIDILINKWPFRALNVSNFVGNMFTSIVIFYSDIEMGQRTRLGVKYSADIVHSFIDALRQRRTKLRHLDITGLPIAEIIIKYVATHCRLAQKEYQRNLLIDEYLHNVSDLESLWDSSKTKEKETETETETLKKKKREDEDDNDSDSNSNNIGIRNGISSEEGEKEDNDKANQIVAAADKEKEKDTDEDKSEQQTNKEEKEAGPEEVGVGLARSKVESSVEPEPEPEPEPETEPEPDSESNTNTEQQLEKQPIIESKSEEEKEKQGKSVFANPNSFVRNDLKKTTSLPDEQLVFKFDCILQERATFDELVGALDANATNTQFILQIGKLDLICLGKSNIIKLLSKLDKQYIEGLRLQYNSITEESIKDILPYITQLTNLQALDLSCNLIDYRMNPDSSRQMAYALGQLPMLNRLDLSGSPLGGCLSSLLARIKQPLQYVSLHSCGLQDSDLFYLANSQHVTMEHLDLSENRLTRFSDALILLLRKCSPTLYVLELDDNRFDCIDYLTIICVARKMSRLKLLATKGTFEMNDHLLGAEFMHHASSLRAWRISFPIDIYDPNESNVVAQEAQKRVFSDRMNSIIKDKFKLVVNELFL